MSQTTQLVAPAGAATPWGEAIPSWQTARHYVPAVISLDRVINNLERLIWEREYPKSRDEKKVDEVIRSPDYRDPLAQWRNTLLAVRNDIATLCGIKARRIHDFGPDALGYQYHDGVCSKEVPIKIDPLVQLEHNRYL